MLSVSLRDILNPPNGVQMHAMLIPYCHIRFASPSVIRSNVTDLIPTLRPPPVIATSRGLSFLGSNILMMLL